VRTIFRWFGPLMALVPFAAQAQTGNDAGPYGPQMMWWDGGWTMMFFGPLYMILMLAAVVVAIVFLVRWLGGAAGSNPILPPTKAPLDILKERFARGEIDKTEYEERRRVLVD
jgi:putative membrane protein